jgi:hypothetical protein
MPFFDSEKQRAEAQVHSGREMIKMAKKMKPKDAIKMHRAGAKEIIEGTRAGNRASQKVGSTRRDNKVR